MSKTDASAVLDNGIGSDGLRPLINSAIQDIKMKRHRRMRDSMKKGIYLFPNLLTTGNLFSGFLAIVYVFDKNYLHAAIAILVAGFFDLLDGRLARFSKTTSRFGIEYDSLSDLVSFGIAPGLLVFSWGLREFGRYGWLAAFLYVACAALRLARFNVQRYNVESKNYFGLPVPMAASLIISSLFVYHRLGQEGPYKHIVVLLMVYALSFLMVSNIRYYGFKEFGLFRRIPFIFLVVLVILLTIIAYKPELMLLISTVLYIASGPVRWFVFAVMKKHENVNPLDQSVIIEDKKSQL